MLKSLPWAGCVVALLTPLGWAQETIPVVRVTGKVLSVNGLTDVPVGLFGVHATKLDEQRVAEWGVESVRLIDQSPSGRPALPSGGRVPAGIKMVVECFYDRYQPALVLTDRNWKNRLETLGRTYAENARATGLTHHVEFWNEPFLNWATRPGVNYDATFYEQDGREVGKPMTIKGWEKPLDHLVWSQQLRLVDPKSGKVHYLANGDPPLPRKNLKEGEMYDFRGRQFRMDLLWWGNDPTQRAWYSGLQNSQFYRWMLVPFARAIKQTNPQVRVIGGWGFAISSDGWHAWDTLYKPMIDDCFVEIDGRRELLLDGIGEHHYGGDTRHVAATYEVAYAYALGRYGKRLAFYNTEAGGMLDPQRPDTGRPTFSGGGVEEWRGMFSYFVRDVTHMIAAVPDKAVARAAHSVDGNRGDQMGLMLLKDLRGRLVETLDPPGRLWSAAGLNGNKLVVAIFNDDTAGARARVDVEAPRGMKLVGGRLRHVDVNAQKQDLELLESPVADLRGERSSVDVELPPKQPRVLVCSLEGKAPAAPQVVRTQHAAKDVLQKVQPGGRIELLVDIPEASLKGAADATLRLVLDGWDDVHTTLSVNGRPVQLPPRHSGINQVRLDPAVLALRTTLTFACKPDAPRPLTVHTASIYTIAHPTE